MDISKVLELEKVDRFDCEYNGTEFWFEARTRTLTPAMQQKFSDLGKHPATYAVILSEVLTDWSIDLAGEPFPPVEENLLRIPVDFLDFILEKIGACWSGNGTPQPKSPKRSVAAAK